MKINVSGMKKSGSDFRKEIDIDCCNYFCVLFPTQANNIMIMTKLYPITQLWPAKIM